VEASQYLGMAAGATGTWNGVTVDSTSILVKYTYVGDLNLNGLVDFDDYALFDRALSKRLPASWLTGDVNYDNLVDSADVLLIDRAFALQGTVALTPEFLARREARFGTEYVVALVTSIPEPSAVVTGWVVAGASAVQRRRRRGGTDRA
jgi:hypothetical protein